jgi:hypothetical protein
MNKPSSELIALADELREYTALRYAGDCKCGQCQLVPRETIIKTMDALHLASSPSNEAMREACKQAVTELDCMYVNGDRIPYGGIPADPESSVWREAIKAAEAAIDDVAVRTENCEFCFGTGRHGGRFSYNDPDCTNCNGTGKVAALGREDKIGAAESSDGGVEGHPPQATVEPESADVREAAGIKPGPSEPKSQEPDAVAWDTPPIDLPKGLHPKTANLVRRFANALAKKLRLAEERYGYGEEWAKSEWEDDCREHLYEHLEKGDPRDVAAYCAFMWHHGWITAHPTKPEAQAVKAALAPFVKEADVFDEIPGIIKTHDDVELWQPGGARRTKLTVGDLRRARAISALFAGGR